MFQDVTPVLADAELFRASIAALVRAVARGGASPTWRRSRAGDSSSAAPVAAALGAGFIPIRKPGKLPFERAGQDYALEYGTGRLEMHEDACPQGARVLVVDDVLATGGTAQRGVRADRAVGATVVGCAFFLAIAALEGRRWEPRERTTLIVA